MRKLITAENAAPPQGVYSPAIKASGTMVFVSGQGPVNPATGKLELGTFEEQARRVFDNLNTLLKAAGTDWAHVVKTGVYLSDLAYFPQMNEIYKTYLTEPYPARTTVKAGLPPGMLIEVDCIAVMPE